MSGTNGCAWGIMAGVVDETMLAQTLGLGPILTLVQALIIETRGSKVLIHVGSVGTSISSSLVAPLLALWGGPSTLLMSGPTGTLSLLHRVPRQEVVMVGPTRET